jgi:molecular chaperone HtpG
MTATQTNPPAEGQARYEFQAETRRLLELMIHSLYSNKDIFLRELISNASDALDKLRFAALTEQSLLPDEALHIRIELDPEARVLTVHDNGIGMSRDEVVQNLGTIARSGTQEFLAMLEKAKDVSARPELIGQFGVGFYSSFLVADRVTVVTRKAGEPTATRWQSDGVGGSYTVEPAERLHAGTSVTLSLKPVDEEDGIQDYTSPWVVESIVRKFSDFVSHPIKMKVEKPAAKKDDLDRFEDKTLNSMKAIWTRPASEVSENEYKEFYKHISHDWNDPLTHLTTTIEGVMEAKALLYLPARAPFDIYRPDAPRRGVQLYVKRVFIMDDCKELLPGYLRFVKGVVDSEDLPLNVSREILQQNRQIRAIRKHLVKKVLDSLVTMMREDRDQYLKFWEQFGAVLKEGLLLSQERNERIYDLVLAESSAGERGKLVSLTEYVGRM